MDLRYWVRHKMHRLGIWINVNVYLLMWVNLKSFIKHLFVLTYSTQGKSAYWCASRWMSPFMTSATSVFLYLAYRISVAKLLSQSSPKILLLAWMWTCLPWHQICSNTNLQVDKAGLTNQTIPVFLLSSLTWILYCKASLYSGWCGIWCYHCERLKPFVDWCACFYQFWAISSLALWWLFMF